MVSTLDKGLGHTRLHNTVWVAIFAKNSFDVVQHLWQSGIGADRARCTKVPITFCFSFSGLKESYRF